MLFSSTLAFVSVVTTIIFDLSDVLIAGLGGLERVLAARTGLPQETCNELLFGQWLVDLCCGEITEEQYLKRVLASGVDAQPRMAPEDLKCAIRETFQYPVAGMDQLVIDLSRRYQLVLFSDHAREWVEDICAKHHFMSLFAERYFSFDSGKSKRQGTAFAEMLTRIRRPSHACLLIDDNPENIEKAAELGIRGIVFRDLPQLLQDLPKFGVVVGSRATPVSVKLR